MRVSDLVGGRKIDLNVDIAEGFPYDQDLLQFATSANICCGVHAGSESLTSQTVARCRELGIRVGAHPGYPDRSTMGRGRLSPGLEREYLKSVFDQVEWFVASFGADYIKPHGGFYHDTGIPLPENWQSVMRRQPLATPYETGGVYLAQFPGIQSLMMLMRIHRLPLLGLDATAHRVVAERALQTLIREGFADRNYETDGTLVSRSLPNALIHDPKEVEAQVLRLAPFVDSICLHGDGPDCVAFAESVFRTLVDAGFQVGF